MHIDFQKTFSTPTISAGAIETSMASLNILSQRGYGINSTVRFYIWTRVSVGQNDDDDSSVSGTKKYESISFSLYNLINP